MGDAVESSFESNAESQASTHPPAKRQMNTENSTRKKFKDMKTSEECKHPIVYKGLCGYCGKDVYEKFEDTEINRNGVDKQFAQGVRVTRQYNEELSRQDVNLLIKNRKLLLLLDLDETLVHTCNRVPEKHEFCEDIIRYQIGESMYFTKIRPYALEFLRRCNDLFEMHIASYGQRVYTHTLTQALDPTTTIFDDRVLSRDELKSSIHKTKNLTDLFPSADRFLIMVDDRADVWEYSDAHIMIRPFKYFGGVADINNPTARMAKSASINTSNPSIFNPTSVVTNSDDDIRRADDKDVETANDKEASNSINKNVDGSNQPEASNENDIIATTKTRKETSEVETTSGDSDLVEQSEAEATDFSASTSTSLTEEAETTISSEPADTATVDKQQTPSSLAAINYYGYDIEKIMMMPLARSGTPGVSRCRNQFKKVIPTGTDKTLLGIAKILTQIHDEFYAAYEESLINEEPFDLDVKTVMADMRRNVLSGEFIVLSGMCELGKDPTKHWLFYELERFGAVGQTDIDERTTVIVAGTNNTEKINAARALLIPVVTAVWLLECIYDWEKHDKTLFTFENSPPIPGHVYVYGNRERLSQEIYKYV